MLLLAMLLARRAAAMCDDWQGRKWIHIPKVGGTTAAGHVATAPVRAAMQRQLDAAPLPVLSRDHTCSAHHIPPRYYGALPSARNPYVDPTTNARHPTACAVRDPLDRWLSEFNYRSRHGTRRDFVAYTRRAVGALAREVQDALGGRRLDAAPLWRPPPRRGPPPPADAAGNATLEDLMLAEVARAAAAAPFAPSRFLAAGEKRDHDVRRLPPKLNAASIATETTNDCHYIPQFYYVYFDNLGRNASCDRVVALDDLDEALCEVKLGCAPRPESCPPPDHRNSHREGAPRVSDLPADLAAALRVLYAPDYFHFGHVFQRNATDGRRRKR